MYQNFKFSVSWDGAITNYVDRSWETIVPVIVGKSRLLDFVQLVDGVKYSKEIPIFDNTVSLKNAADCSTFSDTSAINMSIVTLTTKYLKDELAICLSDLELYSTGLKMPQGSDQEEVPFFNAFMAQKEAKITKVIDQYAFLGNSGLGITGYIASATASGATTLATQSFAVSTAVSNGILLTIDNMIDALDAEYQDEEDLVIFIGREVFDKYTRSIRNLNLYHYNPEDIKNGVVTVAGKYNVKLVATVGLNGANKAILGKGSFFLFGTDLEPSREAMRGEYNMQLDKFIVRYKFKVGFNLIKGDKFVVAKA
jgi:hypothetical protein